MTAPTIVRRRLTINFDRSVRAGKPQVMEVVVVPLATPSSPNNDATLVGGPQSQDVLLHNVVNPVYFDLVPSNSPDLISPLPYRIAWREKFMGTQFTQDFVMPDADCDFDDLQNLGNLIGGETYVQWTDRSRVNGVAGLNADGKVVDAFGNVLTGTEDAAAVQDNLDAETLARQQADVDLREDVDALAIRTTGVETDVAADVANLSTTTNLLSNQILVEKTSREAADTALSNAVSSLEFSTGADITAINSTLPNKADLVDGKVPSAQLPALAVGNAVTVANQAAMLALTPVQVQPGDLCVRPDGTWMLNGTDPSVLSNWVKLTDAGTVASVNGQTGAVVLTAANVNARSTVTPIPLADITGLQAALDAKTNVSSTTALAGRVTAIENSPTIVKTVDGVVPHAQHGSDVVFLSSTNKLVNKDGAAVTPSGLGTVAIADVTGLQSALNSKVPITHASVTDARVPLSHAASHQAGGSDPIILTPNEVTGLAGIISNNQLTSTSNHSNRIRALESGTSGVGTGTGTPVKSVWFDSPDPIGPNATTAVFGPVVQKSPFGRNSGGLWYYNPAGAAEGEDAYPYITPNGHLRLVKRNEANPPDPAYTPLDGPAPSLAATNATVATKADNTALTSTNNTVATKADKTTVDALTATVNTKAAQTALDATNNAVSTKAEQTAVGLLTDAVATKANATGSAPSLAATNTVVSTKASQTAVDAITAILPSKANLSGGLVPLAELPSIPVAKVDTLTTVLGNKADLSGGPGTTIPDAQIPALSTARITGLDAALASKATLVGGKVDPAQLPDLAITNTVVKTDRSGMLALTTAQVQIGDVCVITGTTDQGSYILNAADPAVFTNWTKLISPTGTVSSVNGLSGTVTMTPAIIGAAVAGVDAIPQNYVNGLGTSLAAKVSTSTYTTDMALKANTSAVTGSQVSQNKQQVVAVSPFGSNVVTTNLQPIDGTNPVTNSVVLLAGQTDPINNGIYTVNGSGPWSRSSDMPSGQFFHKGAVVACSAGTANHDTLWQQTAASGVVGTNPQTWVKVLTAGAPPVYTASLGVEKIGDDFRAKVKSGGGLLVETGASGGIKLDPANAVRKYAGYVPALSNPITINHGLNSPDVAASFRGGTSGEAVLVGWKVVDSNNISVEFDSVPTSGTQWRVVVVG